MSDPLQLALDFDQRAAQGAEDFLVTPANAEAVAWVDRWPDWPGPLLTVWGPEGAGKTHLAQVFLARTGGQMLSLHDLPDAIEQGGASVRVIDSYDAGARSNEADEALFHLFNAAKAEGGHILLLARNAPARWSIDLADLRSRLLGSAAVEITEPDDDLLAALIVKHFSDRQLRVDADVITYMVPRMDRTFKAAEALVTAVDAAALRQQRKVTVPLIRDVMAEMPK